MTGAALGADSTVMALSIATGVTKAVMVMVGTPLVAKFIGLDNPRSAMAFGGLMGTVSGVAGGLAATDPKLVPYGALTATFHTGIGCLVGPSLFFLIVRAWWDEAGLRARLLTRVRTLRGIWAWMGLSRGAASSRTRSATR